MKRLLSETLIERLALFPCVAIVGPRQCGKTTLVKDTLKDWEFYDLERASDLASVERDPEIFFKNNPAQVCIDEAQLCPSLFNAMRVAIDANRGQKGRFVITGSSSPILLSKISESLAGRICLLELTPLSNCESTEKNQGFVDWFMSGAKDKSVLGPAVPLNQVFDKWFWGSFPEPWLSNDEKFRNEWLESYTRSYIERDIRALFPRLNIQTFRRFIGILGNVSGQILNLSDIGRSLAVSQPTVREYLEIIEGTFLWQTLLPFEQNVIKRITKHPKGYLLDSGLIHHSMYLPNLKALQGHPSLGRTWESFIFSEIRKGFLNKGIDAKYFHYRTASGSEIDFLVQTKEHLFVFEVKYSTAVEKRDLRAIKDFMKEHRATAGFVVCNCDDVELVDEKIFALPATLI